MAPAISQLTDALRIVLALPEPLSDDERARLESGGLLVVGEVSSARELVRLLNAPLAAPPPQVVLVHEHLPRRDRFPDLNETIMAVWRAPSVLLLSVGPAATAPPSPPEFPPAVRTRARNEGYRGVAAWPALDPEDLYDAVLAAWSTATTTGAAGDERATAPLGPGSVVRAAGTIIGVRSDKGGVGKSAVAEGMAALLAAHTDLRVLLLDMDQAGSALVGALRGAGALTEDKGVLAYCAAFAAWRATPDAREAEATAVAASLLEAATLTYPLQPAAGMATFRVLPGLRGPDQGDLLDDPASMEALGALVDAVRAHYDIVVVDMGQNHLRPAHQAWAIEADRIAVVTQPTTNSVIRAAEGQVRLMNAIGKKSKQCFIVVNKVRDSRYELAAETLRAYFGQGLDAEEDEDEGPARVSGLRIAGLLRFAPDLVEAGEARGIPWPLLPEAPHSRLLDDLYEMCRILLPGVLPARPAGNVALGRAGAALRRAGRALGQTLRVGARTARSTLATGVTDAPGTLPTPPAERAPASGAADPGDQEITPPVPAAPADTARTAQGEDVPAPDPRSTRRPSPRRRPVRLRPAPEEASDDAGRDHDEGGGEGTPPRLREA